MDVSSLQSSDRASTLPFEQLAKNPNVSDSDKVKESCKQFEAVLIRQMLTEARKSVISSGHADSSTKGIYDDMINNQLADSMTHSGGFGLAKSLESQLGSQILKKQPSAYDEDDLPADYAVTLKNSTLH